MQLILKIAAGVIIGVLAARVIVVATFERRNQEAIDKEYQQSSDRHALATDLVHKHRILTNSISSFHSANKVLPKRVSDLDCYHQNWCAPILHQGNYFEFHQGELIAVEPYLESLKAPFNGTTTLRFNCITTFNNVNLSFCNSVDRDTVPEEVISAVNK